MKKSILYLAFLLIFLTGCPASEKVERQKKEQDHSFSPEYQQEELRPIAHTG
jgi:PBP1b-binding outer membrane lipoprotein LpoB